MLCLSVLLILLVEKSGIRLIDGGVHGVIMATAGFLDAKKTNIHPAAMVQEAPGRNHEYHRFHFKSYRWCMELSDIGGSMGIVPRQESRNPYLTAPCAIGNF